jgi:hypothetical protein
MGFLLRWVFAFVLVAASYNPTEWNFWHWASANYADSLPLTLLFALLLFTGYVIYIRATLRSIGGFGMGLILAIFAALVWVLVDMGVLSLTNSAFNIWLGILAMSLVLAIGLSWSFVRRALSGQYDVDDADE